MYLLTYQERLLSDDLGSEDLKVQGVTLEFKRLPLSQLSTWQDLRSE